MQTEIEAKFLAVDHDDLRRKLREAGAELVAPMRLMRRYAFDFPDGRLRQEENGWARVRDEGGKITLSYKRLADRTLHGTKEVGITVDSFENAKALLEALGLAAKAYQETRRESWRMDGAEIELDHWPWTKPYVEIEAADEAAVKAVVAKLGLNWDRAVFGSVEIVYTHEYDVSDATINALPLMTFDSPVPKELAERRKP